jgi:lysozyme
MTAPAGTSLVADMNHANTVDFRRIAAAGIGGVIHKARQGVGFGDPAYASRRLQAVAAGIEWGAYDFATHDDVAENVKDFLATAAPDERTGLWLDFEDNTASEMSMVQALEFLDRVDQAVGRRCGIYGGNRVKELVIGLTQDQRDFLGAHPFWLCEYGPVAKMIDVHGHALPWVKPDLWQQWADGYGPNPPIVDGLEHKADLSIFEGDRAALAAWWPLPAIPAPVVA